MSAPARPAATFGVDVDPVELHLAACGHADAVADPIVYTVALPRLAEIFGRAGVRATFFVLGRDAGAFSRPLAALAAAGHEIASHSFSSPFAFSQLTPAQMRDEMIASRNALQSALRVKVIGFRAPHCDLDRRGIEALIATGYRYDASANPTPWLTVARAALALRSRDIGYTARLRAWPFTLRRDPHVVRIPAGSLVEFPAAVTPWRRWQVRDAVHASMPGSTFLHVIDGFVRRNESLSYPLRALDALGLVEDRLDPRLSGHPGMSQPLDQRLRRLEDVVRSMARRFDVATFAERATAPAAETTPVPGAAPSLVAKAAVTAARRAA